MRGLPHRLPARLAHVAAIAVLGLAPIARAQETKSATPPAATISENASDRRERTLRDAEEALRKSAVPKAIERARFVAFLSAVDPALAQNQGLLDQFEAYRAGLEKQNETSVRQILRLLPAAYTFDAARESYEPRATPELVAMLGLRDKAQRNIASAERKLLDAVQATMPEERKPALARAMLALRSEQAPKSALLPSTRVTLLDVLPKVRLSPEKLADLEITVTAYANVLSKAIAERTATMQANDGARAITEVTAGTLWRYAPAEIAAAVEKQLAELDDREYSSEIAIRSAHFDALGRLRARLDPKDGRRLVELWQQMLHPSLFDDERLLSRTVEQAIAHPALDGDADTALIDVLETIYLRLEPLSRRLCEGADALLPRLAVASHEAMLGEIGARLELIKTQHRRREMIKEALQRVRVMVGDADPAMTARVDDAIASIDSLDRADSFEEKALAARAQLLADVPAPAATRTADDSAKPAEGAKPAGGAAPKPPATGGNGKNAADDSDAAPRNGRGSRGSRRSNDN